MAVAASVIRGGTPYPRAMDRRVMAPNLIRWGAPQQGKGSWMYLARFSYNVLPINRKRAVDFICREVEAARAQGLRAQLLVPLTRGQGDPALQFEIELTSLDQLDRFRNRGVGSDQDTANWIHAFSEILTSPPLVEILRVYENPDPHSA